MRNLYTSFVALGILGVLIWGIFYFKEQEATRFADGIPGQMTKSLLSSAQHVQVVPMAYGDSVMMLPAPTYTKRVISALYLENGIDSFFRPLTDTLWVCDYVCPDVDSRLNLMGAQVYACSPSGEWSVYGLPYFYARDEIMLLNTSNVSLPALETVARSEGLEILSTSFNHRIVHLKIGKSSPTSVRDAIERLAVLGWTSEPNSFVFAVADTSAPNDPNYKHQWALENLHARVAWARSNTISDSVIIAVLDCGVLTTHEDLKDNLWVNPKEILNDIDDDQNGYVDDIHGCSTVLMEQSGGGRLHDDFGHGTHCSGIIAMRGNNGVGGTGLAWNAKLMNVRFMFAALGTAIGGLSDQIKAYDYAREMGAKILSCSYAGTLASESVVAAIDALRDSGILMVVAAGNDGMDYAEHMNYPGAYSDRFDNIITVVNVDAKDGLSSTSSWSKTHCHLGAPGEEIFSTYFKDSSTYIYMSGTSMATPYVSAAAGLLWSLYPGMTYQNVKSRILDAARPIPALKDKTTTGKTLDMSQLLTYHLSTSQGEDEAGIWVRWAYSENYTYRLLRAIASDGPFEVIVDEIRSDSYYDTSAIPGRLYHYKIQFKPNF